MIIQKRFFSKLIIKLLALLCLALWPDVDAKLEFMKKSHEFPGKVVKFNSHSIENENIVFAVCEGPYTEKKCMIVHQNYPYDDISRSCNLTVSIAKGIAGMIRVFMDVRPLGKDKALVIWATEDKDSSRSYVKMATLNMNDCNISEFNLQDSSSSELYWNLYWYDIIIRYNDSYELFIKTENRYGNDIRKLRIDSQTGSTEELNSYLNNEPVTISTVATASPAKGYVYRENYENQSSNNTIFKFWLLKSNGSQKLLQNLKNPINGIISSGNDAIGICASTVNVSNIQCTQYDEDGNVKAITVLDESIATIKAMHMTRQGGFLLLLVDFQGFQDVHYRVIRVDKKGKIVGKLRLGEFDNFRPRLVNPYIYDRGDGNYRISLLSRGRLISNETDNRFHKLDIAVYCFSEADLLEFREQ